MYYLTLYVELLQLQMIMRTLYCNFLLGKHNGESRVIFTNLVYNLKVCRSFCPHVRVSLTDVPEFARFC